jgi:spore germination cell wall hydrolase CwlJ-like protein
MLGQILVARVTLNRAQDESICNTVYQRGQFSWTASKRKAIDPRQYMLAWHAAYAAIGTTYEATYYHSIKVHPRWTKKLIFLQKVGAHLFYKAV